MRDENAKRITATVDQKTFDTLNYIADKKEISLSDLLRDAVDLEIRYENEDYYPLAKLEAQRINQLYDLLVILATNVKNLELVTTNGFSSLLDITKGDDYLYDSDESMT